MPNTSLREMLLSNATKISTFEDTPGGRATDKLADDEIVLTLVMRLDKLIELFKALLTAKTTEARIDELLRMNMRTMDDPEDDTNLFWYRTYTMPEFEARLKQLQQLSKEGK